MRNRIMNDNFVCARACECELLTMKTAESGYNAEFHGNFFHYLRMSVTFRDAEI
jgi:hypothetical protein